MHRGWYRLTPERMEPRIDSSMGYSLGIWGSVLECVYATEKLRQWDMGKRPRGGSWPRGIPSVVEPVLLSYIYEIAGPDRWRRRAAEIRAVHTAVLEAKYMVNGGGGQAQMDRRWTPRVKHRISATGYLRRRRRYEHE